MDEAELEDWHDYEVASRREIVSLLRQHVPNLAGALDSVGTPLAGFDARARTAAAPPRHDDDDDGDHE